MSVLGRKQTLRAPFTGEVRQAILCEIRFDSVGTLELDAAGCLHDHAKEPAIAPGYDEERQLEPSWSAGATRRLSFQRNS